MLGLHFTPACVLLLVCSLHFTISLHFTPGPQSAVCSPQSAFYTDRKCYYFKNCVALPPWFRDCHFDDSISSGGVGHGPRDQFCPITSLQMADWFFHLCAGSLFDFLRFSPFIKWFTIIFFGKVWVDRCSKPQFLKQYDVCLFSIDIVRCNSSCA